MNLMKRGKTHNAGQIVLVVLLVSLVVLTIGLGVASRAITNIKLSRQEEESTRAFNIAEAGIEKYLKETDLGSFVGSPIEEGEVADGITRRVDVSEEGYLETLLKANEVVEINLGGYTGTLSIYWVKSEEDPGTCNEGSGGAPASIEVMVYRQESGTYSVKRSGFNSKGCPSLGNDFAEADSGSAKGFKSLATLDITDINDKLVRLRVIYNKATVKVEGTDTLGAQMFKITSRAQAPVGETRQVEVTRTQPILPAIFDYALFSGGSLVK